MQRRGCFQLIGLLGLLLCAVALIAQQASTGYPLTITDSLNRKVTIKRKPQRIISIAPSATEILFVIGAGSRVIADTTYCDYPPVAARLKKIGGYTNPQVERIVALKPDLVVGARGNPLDILNQIQSLKLTVAALDEEGNIDQVLETIRLIGKVVGEEKGANALVKRLIARRKAVTDKTDKLSEQQRPRVLFLFDTEGLFSAGKGSFIDELIRLAGGQNIAAKSKVPWPELSMESVVADDPQVILVLAGHGTRHPLTSATALANLRKKSQWKSVTAVKKGRVVVVGDDEMTLPGPRLINGLEQASKAIHPEIFAVKGPQ